MNAATRRTVIATAALAAAALFGSLPFDGSSVAQQGVPVQHHDVALVDAEATFLLDEGTFDNALFNDVLGADGAESALYNALGTNAAADLDTFNDAGANVGFAGNSTAPKADSSRVFSRTR